MSWLALGGAALLQLIAGIVRTRGWWHVLCDSRPEWCSVRFRDVALAHVGGVGWNAILPAHSGDAVKVALVARRIENPQYATLATTLIPPALVEAAFTFLLLIIMLAFGVVSVETLTSSLPSTSTAAIAAALAVVGAIVIFLLRKRLAGVLGHIRTGLSVLRRPRILITHVVPWHLAARVIRLLAFALVLVAAGMGFGLGPAIALMALQGATPSAGAAATAARIALLAAVLSKTGADAVSAQDVAAALAAAYGVTSAVNLAASALVMAWVLRTTSPRKIYNYAKSALRTARERKSRSRERPTAEPAPVPGADARVEAPAA